VTTGDAIGKTNLPLVSEGDPVFHIARHRERSDEALQAINELQETFGTGLDEAFE
jgi:hypothetical protein